MGDDRGVTGAHFKAPPLPQGERGPVIRTLHGCTEVPRGPAPLRPVLNQASEREGDPHVGLFGPRRKLDAENALLARASATNLHLRCCGLLGRMYRCQRSMM